MVVPLLAALRSARPCHPAHLDGVVPSSRAMGNCVVARIRHADSR
jgi:hypothetical protein